MNEELFDNLKRLDEQGPGPEADLALDIANALMDLTPEEEKVSIEVVKDEIKTAMDIVYDDVIEELKKHGRMGV